MVRQDARERPDGRAREIGGLPAFRQTAQCGLRLERSRFGDAVAIRKLRRVSSAWTGPPTRRRRQPRWGERAKHSNRGGRLLFHEDAFYFSAFPKKGDPGSRRARVCRRMGEGLGGWGARHPALGFQHLSGLCVPGSAKIIFVGERGEGAIVRWHQPAVPHACRPEIRDSAIEFEGARVLRRGLPPRNACRREIERAGDPIASSLETSSTGASAYQPHQMTRARQLFRERALAAVNVVDSCGKTLFRPAIKRRSRHRGPDP
jgi:hypothetical protein